MKKNKLLLPALLIIISSFASAQTDPAAVQRYRKDQRGTITARREGILQMNLIRTLFQNNGEVAHWPYSPSLEWPKGSGIDYLGGLSLLVSAEVKTKSGMVIHPLQTSYREWMDKDPVTGDLWGLEPVPGYSNPYSNSPALAMNPNSWPSRWPDALGIPEAENNSRWYGFFGMGTVNNLEEAFFVTDDSKDGEWKRPPYNFYPISSDTGFGGLGLRVETRLMESRNFLAEDILFVNHDVINISDSLYSKAYIGYFADIDAGGMNSAADDMGFIKEKNLIYSWDSKGVLTNGKQIGYQSFAVLEPASSGISALSVYMLGDGGVGGGWPKDDESMWFKMSSAVYDTSIHNRNLCMVFASGPQSLIPGRKQRSTLAIVMGKDKEDIIRKKENVQAIHNGAYEYFVKNDVPVKSGAKIVYPVKGSVLSGTAELRWTLPDLYPKATAYFEITYNDRYYASLGADKTQSGKVTFSTLEMKDGIFYKIRATMYNDFGAFQQLIITDYFTINNSGNAAPEVKIKSPKTESLLCGKPVINWTAGDAENDSFKVSIFYRTTPSSEWTKVTEGLSQADTLYEWNSENFANSETAGIMVKAVQLSDTASGYSIVQPVRVSNSRAAYNGDKYTINRKTHGTGKISIMKVNPSVITGHDYKITFDSLNNSVPVFNVTDLSTGRLVLQNQTEMDGFAESGYFDGLRLIVKADTVEVIDSLSGLQPAKNNFMMPIAENPNKQYSIRLPYDYELEFKNMKDIPSFDGNKPPDGPRVNFIAKNLTRGDTVNVLVNDWNGDMVLNPGEDFAIVEFIDKNKNGIYELSERRYNWKVLYRSLGSSTLEPAAGDKFYIRVNKPFIKSDQITFSTKNLTSTDMRNTVPGGYYISQNYPNPFNPSTAITYRLPRQSYVDLSVYDLLGKKITTLVNKIQSAGNYHVNFDGTSLPSGMYICRLKAGEFSASRKLMLVK